MGCRTRRHQGGAVLNDDADVLKDSMGVLHSADAGEYLCAASAEGCTWLFLAVLEAAMPKYRRMMRAVSR